MRAEQRPDWVHAPSPLWRLGYPPLLRGGRAPPGNQARHPPVARGGENLSIAATDGQSRRDQPRY